MRESKKSYQQIFKTTSLFGGVQIFSILISLIKSKIIAVLLGSTGMGIAGLLNSTINLVGSLTKIGLDTSAVKEISSFDVSNNPEKIKLKISVLNRLIWLSGIIGSILMILFSPLLSRFTFDSDQYTIAFIWVSLALLFKQLTDGKIAIFQGLRKLNYLAKSSVLGSFFGLLFTIPLYYFFRIDGIVSAIIISSIIGFIVSMVFYKQIGLTSNTISNKTAFLEGREMLKLGFMLSLMGIITMCSAYLIQIYISHKGGVDTVGFYLAGFVIINSYVGMIFNAMQTDYFPKLSAISDDINKVCKSVTEQAFVAVLMVTPIIIIFLTFMPFLIQLLYSKEFLVISGMLKWGILATLFKALSFSMGYVILAKGDSKLFMKTTVFFNLALILFSIVGFNYNGLTGVGIGFLFYYVIHLIGLKVITAKTYGLNFEKGFLSVFFVCLLLSALTLSISFIQNDIIKYSFMSLMIVISSIFTFNQLNKKIDFKDLLSRLIQKKDDQDS